MRIQKRKARHKWPGFASQAERGDFYAALLRKDQSALPLPLPLCLPWLSPPPLFA